MNAHPTILRIALDVPLDTLFDYLDNGLKAEIGQRVLVQFGFRQLVGVLVEKATTSDYGVGKLKPIIAVLEDSPVFDAEMFELVKFCADYYQYPFGQALINTLPVKLRKTQPSKSRVHHGYVLTSHGSIANIDEIPSKKIVMRKIMSALHAQNILAESDLKSISSSWRTSMGALIALGWVDEVPATETVRPHHQSSAPPSLNREQQEAVNQVITYRDQFQAFLLHGITGSGKTEVYMQILQQILDGNDGQALVLVPEINLTPQLESRFKNRLSHLNIVTLHSTLSDGERLHNWRLSRAGQARIIIGTRLSIFAPLPKLKVIIVDEEHDSSYKQQDSMRYHARDIAVVRAQKKSIPIIMGTATPSLETWHNVKLERYRLLSMNHRAVSHSVLPAIRCIDTNKTDNTMLYKTGLTHQLIEAISARLKKSEQSLLFINRRGYSPVLLCNACHWIAPCTKCSAKLVVHLKQNRLRCHHCGHEQKFFRQCPDCGNPDLKPTGQGTQRLEETLRELFPNARIQRVDSDNTRNKHSLTKVLEAVNANEIDILVGTQMLAKGHDFPNLTLVGVIDSDSALFSPDFRASERLFSQLMQVSGRAGRAEKAGEVLIQTAFPEHALFHALREQDYAAYAQLMLTEREIAQFPPYSYFALLRAEAREFAPVEIFLNHAVRLARALKSNAMIYEPIRPQMEKLNGLERGQILMQSAQRNVLQKLLKKLVLDLRQHPNSNKIRWSVDVDPIEF